MATHITTVNAEQAVHLLNQVRTGFHNTPAWFQEAYFAGEFMLMNDRIILATGSEKIVAMDDSWLIQNVQGEISIMNNNQFQKFYQPV